MNFYRRKLPHWQPEGADYFITFRLAGSIPKEVVKKIIQECRESIKKLGKPSSKTDSQTKLQERIHRSTFKKYEQFLDQDERGPMWLSDAKIARVIQEAIHYRDQKEYDLYAYCIMSNHVHLVFGLNQANNMNPYTSRSIHPVTDILKSLKWYTARESNKILKRTGKSFWQSESYDHVIRDSDELERIIFYTLQNPVKAGLVSNWQKWPYSYCKSNFLDSFREGLQQT